MNFEDIVKSYYHDSDNFYNALGEDGESAIILTDEHSLDIFILGLALNKMLEDDSFDEDSLKVIDQYVTMASEDLAESVLSNEDYSDFPDGE